LPCPEKTPIKQSDNTIQHSMATVPVLAKVNVM
jgi:hypothetical protein